MYSKLKTVDVDTIVAISRGGLVISRILSDFLSKPISHITISSYESLNKTKEPFIDEAPSKLFKNESILIVDEVSDTGKTFERAVSYFKNFPVKKIYTASPYIKPQTQFTPDFWVKKLEAWIVFPYEIRETVEAFQKIFTAPGKAQEKLIEVGLDNWETDQFTEAK